MKKNPTQKELISEDFWRGMRKLIGGAGRGIDHVLGAVAPEIQKLYKNPYKFGKSGVNKILGKHDDNILRQDGKLKQNVDDVGYIRDSLRKQGFTVLNKPIEVFATDPKTGDPIYSVSVFDRTNGQPRIIYTDSDGTVRMP